MRTYGGLRGGPASERPKMSFYRRGLIKIRKDGEKYKEQNPLVPLV